MLATRARSRKRSRFGISTAARLGHDTCGNVMTSTRSARGGSPAAPGVAASMIPPAAIAALRKSRSARPRATAQSTRAWLQVRRGVDRVAVQPDFEVQVRAGRHPGAADVADHLACADPLSGTDGEARLVRVHGAHPAAVIDDD